LIWIYIQANSQICFNLVQIRSTIPSGGDPFRPIQIDSSQIFEFLPICSKFLPVQGDFRPIQTGLVLFWPVLTTFWLVQFGFQPLW